MPQRSDTWFMHYEGFIYSDEGANLDGVIECLRSRFGPDSIREGVRDNEIGVEINVELQNDEGAYWDVVRFVREVAPMVQFGHITPIRHFLVA